MNDEALAAGAQAHSRHGENVAALLRWQRVGYVLLVLGCVLGVIALCMLLGGNL